ncbi:hypothetical protein [Nocardioides sp.]|uniref:hypothetical protein n=1 Tax=Nocardioides sp. TaxID=35761 RepID=UPI0035B14CB7
MRTIVPLVVARLLAATVVAALLQPPHAHASPSSPAERPGTALPTITVTLGASLSVSAPDVRAGWAHLDVTGAGRALVVRFADGYDIDAFTEDYESIGSGGRKGRRAYARILDGTSFLGGVGLGGSGSIKLPRPGPYTVMAIGTRSGIVSATFRAGPSTPATRARPATGGRLEVLPGLRWGGSSVLPHEGRLLLANRSPRLPHDLVLQRVREGTTAEAYRAWLSSNEAEPNFNLPGRLETQWLSPRRRMTVDYRLPRGQYVVMCFLTDPWSQIAHVLAGELRMIHLE